MYLREAEKTIERLTTRVDVLEHFIKMQFPEYFAGEVGTVVDLELNPIPILYGDPQESDPAKWETPSTDIIRQGKLK